MLYPLELRAQTISTEGYQVTPQFGKIHGHRPVSLFAGEIGLKVAVVVLRCSDRPMARSLGRWGILRRLDHGKRQACTEDAQTNRR